MFKVHYKCACMESEATVNVRHREDGDGVEVWFEEVRQAVSDDHRARSRWCCQSKMEYVKLPLPENADHLGGKPKLHS